LHPSIAARSCADCQAYLYYDRGYDDFGARVERAGKPVLRPKGVKTPCGWCPKIPPGEPLVPASAVELSDKNAAAYFHYVECRAVGEFPRDAIVVRNAALIRAAEDIAERVQQTRSGLAAIAGLKRAQ
jgi:hypothetical protein